MLYSCRVRYWRELGITAKHLILGRMDGPQGHFVDIHIVVLSESCVMKRVAA